MDNNENIEQIIMSVITGCILIFSLYSIIYIYKRKNKIPFSNISPYLLMISIFALMINQILSYICYLYYKENIFVDINFFNFILIHGLIWLPLIIRLYDLHKSIKLNYIHMKNRISKEKYKDNWENFLKNKFFKPKLNWFWFKHNLFPFLGFLIFIFCLYFIEEIKCCFLYWIDTAHKQRSFSNDKNECKILNKNDENYYDDNNFIKYIIADLMRNVMNFGETTFYIFLLYLSTKYPWKKDNFLMIKEYKLILIVSIIFNNIFPLIYIKIEYTRERDFFNNSSRIFSFLFVYFYSNFKRNQVRIENINVIIDNFNNFMSFPPFYNYFQDHIFKKYENNAKYLDFWVNYHILDNKIYERNKYFEMRENKPDYLNKINKEIKNKVLDIHRKYYGFSNYTISNLTNSTSKSEYRIEFPIDMQEKVDDLINKYTDDLNFASIYEESYNFVSHYLSNIHSDLIVKDKEIFENILFVANFFELVDSDDQIN